MVLGPNVPNNCFHVPHPRHRYSALPRAAAPDLDMENTDEDPQYSSNGDAGQPRPSPAPPTGAVVGATTRRRARKACDRCNASRARCDAAQPCGRCTELSADCTYERQSGRRGRPRRTAVGLILPHCSPAQAQAALVRTSGTDYDLSNGYQPGTEGNSTPHRANFSTQEPCQRLSGMDCTTPFIGMPEWLMDAWAAEPWGTMDGNWSHSGQVTEPDMPEAHLQCLDVHSSNLSYVSNNGDHATISASSSSLRYPVLAPVIPHLRPHISSNLACDLLDAYFKDHPEQPHIPASPILLTHVFRKSVFLTHVETRSCTPALLCSMLLIAAVTTESPFFGASPTARARLLDRLLTTTINLSRFPGYSGATQHASPGESASPRQHGRHRFVDEVATYLHLALASMVTEVGSFASIWWRTAFQLAKEYRLNADIACRHQGAVTSATGRPRCPTSGGSGQCDSPYDGPRSQPAGEEDPTLDIEGAIVVDRKDYRFLNASPEEMEERRRIWWTLFIWDKQVALAHNAPVVLTELDCRETLIPVAEEMWQSNRYAAVHHQARDEDGRLSDIFNFLVPFSGVLELMIDQHRAALRTDPAQLDFFQLRYAQPKRQALAKLSEAFDYSINNQSSNRTEREQPWTAYRKFLCRVPLVLDGMSWDMALALQGCTVGRLNAPAQANSQSAHLKNIHALSQSLQEVLTIDPDLNMNHLFCDIFLFLSASIVHVMLASFGRSSPVELVHAGEIFVRALESSVSTSRIEHQRKMRRLLLMSLAVARGSKEVSQVDLDLQQQIITTYRWSAGGYGVGG